MGLRLTAASTAPNPLPHQDRGHLRRQITAVSAVQMPLPHKGRGHLRPQPSHPWPPNPGHTPDTGPGHLYLTQVTKDTRRVTRAGPGRTDKHR